MKYKLILEENQLIFYSQRASIGNRNERRRSHIKVVPHDNRIEYA